MELVVQRVLHRERSNHSLCADIVNYHCFIRVLLALRRIETIRNEIGLARRKIYGFHIEMGKFALRLKLSRSPKFHTKHMKR